MITTNLKYQPQHGMINLNYQMGHFRYVSDIEDYFEHILKKYNEEIDNPSIRIYVNKIESRITFKIKYLDLSIPETMILFGRTEKKIAK